TTPFNIGRRIELADFTPGEAALLASGLGPWVLGLGDSAPSPQGPTPRAQRLLHRILSWTGGHPYLTQRLCPAVARAANWRMGEATRSSHSPPPPFFLLAK